MMMSTLVIVFSLLMATCGAFVPGPDNAPYEGSFVNDWVVKRDMAFARDKDLCGKSKVVFNNDYTVDFDKGGKGFWRLDRPKGGVPTLTVDVLQDESGDTRVTYEIPVAAGRFTPHAVRWLDGGSIYYQDDTAMRIKRKRIGSFTIDVPGRIKPVLDRSFR